VSDLLHELTNREAALLIWLGVALVVMVMVPSFRKSLGQLLKAAVFSVIGIALAAMLVYVGLLVFTGYKIGLWQPWMLKDTLFWVAGSALVLFFGATKAATDARYFRRVASDNLRFAAVLMFILNLYSFPIGVELALIPLLVLLGGLVAVAGTQEQYAPVRKPLGCLVGLAGMAYLTYAAVHVLTKPRQFVTFQNLADFLLPLALSVAVLPFLYALALFVVYDHAFRWLGWLMRDNQDLRRFAQWRLFHVGGLRLRLVDRLSREGMSQISKSLSRAEIIALFARLQRNP
jgi:hypothetical protein